LSQKAAALNFSAPLASALIFFVLHGERIDNSRLTAPNGDAVRR